MKLQEMTLSELLAEQEEAYLTEREITQFNGDWRPIAAYLAEIAEEIERRRKTHLLSITIGADS